MTENMITGEIELTPREAAQYLGVSEGHLANDRIGPRRIPYLKFFRKVRYLLSDLEKLKVYHPAVN